MRRLSVLLVLVTSNAWADDPRDIFGIKRPPTEAPIDCTDGRDFGCVQSTDPFSEQSPLALSTWLSGTYLLSLPVGDATHDQVAAYAMGTGTDGAGVSFGGATGLENRWTVEGAPTDSLRTGANETSVPLVFLDGILVTAGGFAARDRASTGGNIDARLKKGGDHATLDAYVWAGYSGEPRQQEIAPDTFQVRVGSVRPTWTTTAAVVATGPLGPLLGGKAWYAAGIAPSLHANQFRWTASRVVDKDNDGVPDGLPGLVDGELIETSAQDTLTYSVPAMARVGLDRGPHHVDLSLVGSAASSVFYLYNSTIQAAGVDTSTYIGDAIATYRGEWDDTHVRAQFAWHRAMRRQSARDPAAANQPQFLSTYVPNTLPEDQALGDACNDTSSGDPYPKITNCPVPRGLFASGGAGELVDTTADRPSITVDLAHRIGDHVARVGATGEDSRLVTDSRFTGGSEIFSLFPSEQAVRQFIDPNLPCDSDPTKACPTVNTSELSYRTRYTAAYVEDTWRPTSQLQTDAGLRWELMWVGTALHLSNELAPRFGLSWDPYGRGRSRVWVSGGRQFAMLPAGLGATTIGTDRTVDTISSPFGEGRSIATGAPIRVIAGVKPVSQDELTVGGEVAVVRATRLRTWLQGRWLARGLGLTAEGLDNPGRDHDYAAASRNTLVAAVELETAPTAKLVLRAGYTYTQAIGSWPGPYDPREGAILYANPDFELPNGNLSGSLPTDLGHRLYIEAARHGRVGDVAWTFATRLSLSSGRPRDVLIDGSDGLIYAIPRGAGGRNPMVSQANVRLAARWAGFDLALDIFNVFDQRTTTYVDPSYATGAFQPIQGGAYEDLVFLRDSSGQPVTRKSTYGLGLQYQAPIEAMLGIHRAF